MRDSDKKHFMNLIQLCGGIQPIAIESNFNEVSCFVVFFINNDIVMGIISITENSTGDCFLK